MTETPSAGRQVRRLVAAARELLGTARVLLTEHDTARSEVRGALEPLTRDLVRAELRRLSVSSLSGATTGRLRIEPLQQAGYASVLEVLETAAYQLQAVPGIGAQSAAQLKAAADRVEEAVRESVAVRIDVDDQTPGTTALVMALSRLAAAGPDLPRAVAAAGRLDTALTDLLAAARPARSRLRLLLAGRDRRTRALEAAASLVEVLEIEAETPLLLTQVTTDLLRSHEPAEAWIDFELSASEYFSLLAEIADQEPDPEASRGYVPDELAARVLSHPLDDAHRRVSLRGYQDFGARFALAQGRVLLGDEMGLGKAIEAIAVLSHLRAEGRTHFLVACPASVLVTWIREIEARSMLAAHRLHGSAREDATARWLREGGVAVITLDSLYRLEIPANVPVAALVVDEAHFVKNPQTRRAKAVQDWCRRVDRVLFLTGTPMENNLTEFRTLVGYLQPRLAERLTPGTGAGEPEGFRKAVAPVYLRRNRKDVLTELPDLVIMDEWTEFSTADLGHYRSAVESGNFIAMRTAGYAAEAGSAKLGRLKEIVQDAAEHDLKVVVFSNFRSVLTAVGNALDGAVRGSIGGGVPPERRQEIIDEFSATRGHAVLLGQIQSGGIGLNLQAASVVILCEPQIKPSLESQAIARAHRMGQVRAVRAHRLLTAEGVDQRMLDLLHRKSDLFDAYLRRSDLAESAPEAIDITEPELARRLVEEEQLRLAVDAHTS